MLRNKSFWMSLAEIIDAFRIFPRFLVTLYFGLVAWCMVYLTLWYAHLPSAERTMEVTAFYGMLMGGLFGLAAYVFRVYSDGGYDWEAFHKRPPCQSFPTS